MEYSLSTDENFIDLSQYSVIDSCLWLLTRLNAIDFIDRAYTLPFCSYVVTWPDAVPLTSIVIGQDPYPNDIFSPIAAAMSYDTNLCISKMNKELPPTVQVLANDLYINAGMKKETCIELIKNGWALASGGMLLVNEGVFYKAGSAESHRESANQNNVLIRLLRETEKHGKRTVDIYAMGEAGERMASNLCSWFKSDIVRLSKRKVRHPAGVSRRFSNLNDPLCHMETPSFSRSFAKCLSNHVALLHTMAKKSEQDIRLQRQADILRSLGEQLPKYQQDVTNHTESMKELRAMNKIDDDEFRKVLDKIISTGDTLALRAGITASLMSNLSGVTQTMSGQVAKAAPSLGTVNPSVNNNNYNTIRQSSAPPEPVSSTKIVLSRRKPSAAITENSSFTQVSSPPSVASIPPSDSTPIKLSSRRIRPSVNSTISRNTDITSMSNVSSKVDTERTNTPTIESPSANFRKQNLTASINKSEITGDAKKNENTLTKEQINQLSSVMAVIQANKDDADTDGDCQENLDTIQHDISQKTIWNFIVRDLVKAIDEDTKNIPNFDFSNWAIDPTKSSRTFEVCKEYFEF